MFVQGEDDARPPSLRPDFALKHEVEEEAERSDDAVVTTYLACLHAVGSRLEDVGEEAVRPGRLPKFEFSDRSPHLIVGDTAVELRLMQTSTAE